MTDDLQYGTITGNSDVRIPVQGLVRTNQKLQGNVGIGSKGVKELRFLPRSEFPEQGSSSILYIDTTNNGIYYWNGSIYEELSSEADQSNIYAKTKAEWAQQISLVSEFGSLYIYTDYRQEDGVNIPAMKIGDGMAYVVDLPFFSTGVTEQDRQRWDNKVSAFISPLDPENVIFSTD